MIITKIEDLKVGQKYIVSHRFGQKLGKFIFVQPEGMNNDESLFFDSVKGNHGHTCFKEDFQNYIYKESK